MDHEVQHASTAPTITQRAIREFRSFLVLFLYLWVLFGLFVLNEAIIARQHGIEVTLQGIALLNAFVLAKVMLVIEKLELARWLRGMPSIVTILYEAAVCAVLFLCFHFVERLVVETLKGSSASAGDVSVGGGGLLGVLIVGVILFVSLLPFFAFKNVTIAIGDERMRQILFGRPASDEMIRD